MRRPAVFFDRDNTLIVGNDYLGDPNEVVLVAGAAAAVARCRAMGFATIVVSNQSGVARGMFGEDAVQAVNRRMDELLLEHNPAAVIDRHEYCPFHPDAKIEQYRQDSFLRKPKPGMILAAADAMALDLSRSWVIGDAPRDIAAGKAAGCRTILIIDPTLAPSPAALETSTISADFTVTTLIEAVEVVATQTHRAAQQTREAEKPALVLAMDSKPAETKPTETKNEAKAPEVKSPEPRIAGPKTTDPIKALDQVFEIRSTPAAPVADPAPKPAKPRPRETPRDVAPTPDAPRPAPTIDLSRLELMSQQILVELKKLNEQRHDDFSVSKLVAGITQVLACAAVMLGYFMFRGDMSLLQTWLLAAVFLQTFTIALLIMSRQK